MPVVRPFRALRYDAEAVGDLARVISPPYDVVSATERSALLARDPRNVIRIELPVDEPGEEPDAKYRQAARALAAWRSDGTLRKDPRAALYVYEQTYRAPGSDVERMQRGVFARLRLEPFGPGSGIRPHERTLSAAREDRYRLLRATGTNVSPVVGLFGDEQGTVGAFLDAVTAASAAIDVTDDEGVRHRLWVATDADADGRPSLAAVCDAIGAGPITIADGHHRYETALRYRDERRMTRSCEEDPAFDYILALLLDVAQPLTVLPTHRILRGLHADARAALHDRLGELFDVRAAASPHEAAARFAEESGDGSGGRGRFAILAPNGSALLTARRDAFGSPAGATAADALDVALLGIALERLVGIDPSAVASGRIEYTKSIEEALRAVVDAGDVAFLLEPTPVASVIEVAAEGGVMPQKSTYFHPKAITGLVLNPHEW
ncbi:MAG TPA: DUF1015 domain-containing protein [Candidatus Limnocylindrales bacterium]|nr:DUF1015 domain-containing protein [Candidatus Limnocylindrales bacterium]